MLTDNMQITVCWQCCADWPDTSTAICLLPLASLSLYLLTEWLLCYIHRILCCGTVCSGCY